MKKIVKYLVLPLSISLVSTLSWSLAQAAQTQRPEMYTGSAQQSSFTDDATAKRNSAKRHSMDRSYESYGKGGEYKDRSYESYGKGGNHKRMGDWSQGGKYQDNMKDQRERGKLQYH
jgi:hypothetical protein